MTTAKKPPPRKPAKVLNRPALDESAVWRTEIEEKRAAVAGVIDLIDASEIQANDDCERAIALLREKRAAEAKAQAERRADLERIRAGCVAALNASEASNVVALAGRDAA